jgi:DNA-directed RNA polymerase specialized sigma24 family protein
VAAQHDDDFAAYVNGRLPVLRRVAAQLAGAAHRGDDLVQQAITRLYTRWKRASATENLDGYVYKILSRVFLDEQRRRWATVRLGTSAANLAERSGGWGPVPVGDFAAGVADRMLLRDALAMLRPSSGRRNPQLRWKASRRDSSRHGARSLRPAGLQCGSSYQPAPQTPSLLVRVHRDVEKEGVHTAVRGHVGVPPRRCPRHADMPYGRSQPAPGRFPPRRGGNTDGPRTRIAPGSGTRP